MKVEVLFPELCNLYGDTQNMKYFKLCLPQAEFIETALDEEPTFVKEDVNFIYLGSMKERTQEKVIKKLLPYKERIKELIDKNTIFLFTGNALEVLEKYIQKDDGTKIEALGIFDSYAKREMFNRYHGLLLGEAQGIDIIGFQANFSFSYGENEGQNFLNLKKGIGFNKEKKVEGIRKNNFIGTYLIGPFLILNPIFTKYIMNLMGVKNPELKYEKAIMDAYETKLAEFKNPKIK